MSDMATNDCAGLQSRPMRGAPLAAAGSAKVVQFDLDYARQVIRTEAEAIASMTPIVDEAFARAAEMIYHCTGSCIVSGIGKAGIIARKISATLASTGTPSHFLHPAEAVHGDLGRLRRDDIVMVLSYGGETDEIIRLINLVKQLQIRLISVTGDGDSTVISFAPSDPPGWKRT